MDNINREFDHLSVVPEENSTENSEKTNSIQNEQWNCEKDVIKPDQSYPNYQENKPVNFFHLLKSIKHSNKRIMTLYILAIVMHRVINIILRAKNIIRKIRSIRMQQIFIKICF